ncbi:unnamed protein product, partial [Prorocentrum cordatum]
RLVRGHEVRARAAAAVPRERLRVEVGLRHPREAAEGRLRGARGGAPDASVARARRCGAEGHLLRRGARCPGGRCARRGRREGAGRGRARRAELGRPQGGAADAKPAAQQVEKPAPTGPAVTVVRKVAPAPAAPAAAATLPPGAPKPAGKVAKELEADLDDFFGDKPKSSPPAVKPGDPAAAPPAASNGHEQVVKTPKEPEKPSGQMGVENDFDFDF